MMIARRLYATAAAAGAPAGRRVSGLLWFDNIVPLQAHKLDPRWLLATNNAATEIPRLLQQPGLEAIRILRLTPRRKEGGAFVQFEADECEAWQTPQQVTKSVIGVLKAQRPRAAWTRRPIRCNLVQGQPFLEDLSERFPSNKLCIQVAGSSLQAINEVTEEFLFRRLRHFGPMADIKLSAAVKDIQTPRFARVEFQRVHGAVGARNCLHGVFLPLTPSPPSVAAAAAVHATSPSPAGLAPHPAASSSLPAGQLNVLQTEELKVQQKEELKVQQTEELKVQQTEELKVQHTEELKVQQTEAQKVQQKEEELKVQLLFQYEPFLKTSVVTDFAVKHPRLFLPLLGILLASFTLLIFDPVRAWNIRNRITARYSLDELMHRAPFAWLKKHLQSAKVYCYSYMDRLGRSSSFSLSSAADGEQEPSWPGREQDELLLRSWLHAQPVRLMFVTGNKSTGKLELVHKLTAQRKNVLYIDAARLLERPAGDDFVKALCETVGFAPGFGFVTWLGAVVDMFSGAGGASKGPAGAMAKQSTETIKVLELVSRALLDVRSASASSKRRHIRAAAESDGGDLRVSASTRGAGGKDEEDDEDDADEVPLLVIEGFTEENREKQAQFMSTLVQWSQQMTSQGLARVLFLTDTSLAERVTYSMADVKTAEVQLGDASLEQASEFVRQSLRVPALDDATREAVRVVGGRYADLVMLVRALQSSSSTSSASSSAGAARAREVAEEIAAGAESMLRQLLFSPPLPSQSASTSGNTWSRVQLWQTIMKLAESPIGQAGYDDVLFNIFQGDDAALRALVRADLLRIVRVPSVFPEPSPSPSSPRPLSSPAPASAASQYVVVPGSPVLLEAMRRSAQRPQFRAGLDVLVLKHLVAQETAKVQAMEQELERLSLTWGRARELEERAAWLQTGIAEVHIKVAALDRRRRQCEAAVKG